MEEIRKILGEVVERVFGVEVEIELTVAPENTGADYATNVAMKLAKLVHKAPMVSAEMIKRDLDNGDYGVEATIAAPGFLNFRVKDSYFAEKVWQMSEGITFDLDKYHGQTVVVEFSDPNPFKVLHVGHLYTSVVGDGISRLLELAGAKVVRANFGGDVGLHVGKTLYAMLETFLKQAGKDKVAFDDLENVDQETWQEYLDGLKIEDIAKCYVRGTQAYDEDEIAKETIVILNKEVYRINAAEIHDTKVAQLYWRGRELSYQYFKSFYAQIGVHFDKFYPESAVAGRGLSEVQAHVGSVYEQSDGAIVYRGEQLGLHTRVFINREGVPTYETKDVGLLFTKWDDWHFKESVVVTGNEQADYMKVVLASVAEYAPELVQRTTHLTHGLVKLPGNVKMSSRKGNFLKAVEVLEMVRNMLGGEKADEKLVLAATKYAFLKYKMGGDIVFDPHESVSTTGNSGIYILYSVVRAQKILAKSDKDIQNVREINGFEEDEQIFVRKLNKKLTQYVEVLREAIDEKASNKICTFLYELAQEFSRFYENVHVAGNLHEGELLRIVKAYANVMEHGLDLLGIEIPEKM